VAIFMMHYRADFMSATETIPQTGKVSTFQCLADRRDDGADLLGQSFPIDTHDLKVRLIDGQEQLAP
jgi:hypothetical protein